MKVTAIILATILFLLMFFGWIFYLTNPSKSQFELWFTTNDGINNALVDDIVKLGLDIVTTRENRIFYSKYTIDLKFKQFKFIGFNNKFYIIE